MFTVYKITHSICINVLSLSQQKTSTCFVSAWLLSCQSLIRSPVELSVLICKCTPCVLIRTGCSAFFQPLHERQQTGGSESGVRTSHRCGLASSSAERHGWRKEGEKHREWKGRPREECHERSFDGRKRGKDLKESVSRSWDLYHTGTIFILFIQRKLPYNIVYFIGCLQIMWCFFMRIYSQW